MSDSHSWWITITPTKLGRFVAWASVTQPPRHATTLSMLTFPGEVHFAIGDTAADARGRLEMELPERA